ncbi:MAG TPA: hypothetical protein VGO25_06030 [Rhodanobacteraceae bacterium]|nr:hypothetical protein [Rhodanobacteraceae bacterium]
MKLLDRRKQADAALSTLEHRERAWRTNTRVVRAWFMEHRAGMIVGGGLGAGFATSLLPIAPLLRLVSALAGTVSLMLEGPFLRLLSAAHRETSSAKTAATTQ